ncbi:MFS transporter [Bradyrhizobium sp. ORS 111]|uniref:MFS transporter n=1 Tax=Bradyrhizobium sp. ORS 111 TaxID=1685958 RepID=UPI003890CC3F
MPTQAQPNWSARSGVSFVLLFGAVNLFADMTYEGARSVTGPFLGMLGASGFIVGAVTGFGEFLGYALRLVSGRWADRSRLYWPITLGGYVLQMVSVPALALSGSWPVAVLLILLERIGRATRNPPRDVMLAQAGKQMGRGWAFGVNEAMDQFGALIGPLAVAGLLAWRGDFHLAFALLALPAAITLCLVFGARANFPNAGRIEREPQTSQVGRYPPAYWWYCLGAGLVGFGFADFSLISFHFSRSQIVANDWIAVFYALAMGAGGLGSLIIGKLFDRLGMLVLVPVTVLVAAYAPLAFFGGFTLSLIGALLWGIGLGAHESVMQAAVAQMVAQQRLGSAYGVFGAIFGVAWFVGSAALGALYDVSTAATVAIAVIAQLLAIVPIAIAARRMRAR